MDKTKHAGKIAWTLFGGETKKLRHRLWSFITQVNCKCAQIQKANQVKADAEAEDLVESLVGH